MYVCISIVLIIVNSNFTVKLLQFCIAVFLHLLYYNYNNHRVLLQPQQKIEEVYSKPTLENYLFLLFNVATDFVSVQSIFSIFSYN